MPQMAPSLWLFMLIIMSLTIMAINTNFYFYKKSPNPQDKVIGLKNKNNLIWKW